MEQTRVLEFRLICDDTKPKDYAVYYVKGTSEVYIDPQNIDQNVRIARTLEQICKAYPSINITLSFLGESSIIYKDLSIAFDVRPNFSISIYGNLKYKDIPFAIRIISTILDKLKKI